MTTYVIDTSALLRNEQLLSQIHSGEIVLHTVVLEELDRLKRKRTTEGAIARRVINFLYKIRGRGSFEEGIKIGRKVIRFDDSSPDLKYLRYGYSKRKTDNLVLCVAKKIQEVSHSEVILMTGDRMLSIKACYEELEVEVVSEQMHVGKKCNQPIKRRSASANNRRR